MKSSQIMKKFLIIIINVILMAAILVFVVLYSGYESRESYRRQVENFENTTVTMERVTVSSGFAMCGHVISTART